MKNKLKLGHAAGVVAFAIIIGAASMNVHGAADTSKATTKDINTINAGVALDVNEM